MKKFFSCMGAFALICFSFYYTDSAVDIVKRNDPIMQEIINVSSNYEEEPVNAVLVDNNIIPGISGIKVNVDKSYEKMKKYGSFNTSLLVFEEVEPSFSSSNTYDKYITVGNDNKQSVSLLLKLTTTSYLDEILDILKDKNTKITFVISQDILYNDYDIIEKIYLNGHALEVLSNDYSKDELNKINKSLKMLINTKAKYCYTEVENEEIMNNCKKNKMHSIVPNIITSTFPYSDIKNNVVSGSIISLKNDISTVRELTSIINYLNQKGYKIILLEDLLDE